MGVLYRFASTIAPSTIKKDDLVILFLGGRNVGTKHDATLAVSYLFLSRLFLMLTYPFTLFLFSFSSLFNGITVLSSKVRTLFFLICKIIAV